MHPLESWQSHISMDKILKGTFYMIPSRKTAGNHIKDKNMVTFAHNRQDSWKTDQKGNKHLVCASINSKSVCNSLVLVQITANTFIKLITKLIQPVLNLRYSSKEMIDI
jgi:hypothetical protein